MKKFTVEEIISVLKSKNYVVFENDTKEYNLNIVGIRSSNTKCNKFDDLLCVFWKYVGTWEMEQWAITTDPGKYWLEHPNKANVNGTAILKEGQYRNAYSIGLHRNKYEALVQMRPVIVYRDRTGDDELNFDGDYMGMFGINIHRSNPYCTSVDVNEWSAGCQVFSSPMDFKMFMSYCGMARKNFGNSFTYTLLNESDFLTTE